MKKQDEQRWRAVTDAENQALGLFAGGFLAEADKSADPSVFGGAQNLTTKEKRDRLKQFFIAKMNDIQLAARSLDSLGDDDVEVLFSEYADMEKSTSRRIQ